MFTNSWWWQNNDNVGNQSAFLIHGFANLRWFEDIHRKQQRQPYDDDKKQQHNIQINKLKSLWGGMGQWVERLTCSQISRKFEPH